MFNVDLSLFPIEYRLQKKKTYIKVNRNLYVVRT